MDKQGNKKGDKTEPSSSRITNATPGTDVGAERDTSKVKRFNYSRSASNSQVALDTPKNSNASPKSESALLRNDNASQQVPMDVVISEEKQSKVNDAGYKHTSTSETIDKGKTTEEEGVSSDARDYLEKGSRDVNQTKIVAETGPLDATKEKDEEHSDGPGKSHSTISNPDTVKTIDLEDDKSAKQDASQPEKVVVKDVKKNKADKEDLTQSKPIKVKDLKQDEVGKLDAPQLESQESLKKDKTHTEKGKDESNKKVDKDLCTSADINKKEPQANVTDGAVEVVSGGNDPDKDKLKLSALTKGEVSPKSHDAKIASPEGNLSIPSTPESVGKEARKSSKEQLTSPELVVKHSTPKSERKKHHKSKSKKKNSRDNDLLSPSPIISQDDEKSDITSASPSLSKKGSQKSGTSKKKSKLTKTKSGESEATEKDNTKKPKKEKGVVLKEESLTASSNNGVTPVNREKPSNKIELRDSFINKDINLISYLSMKEFSNSVDVFVNDKKFICSGVILAYHSTVFEYQLAQGARMISLDEIGCPVGNEGKVEECLLLLYGAGVIITDANIDIIVRFSVLYKIENMYRLALEWVRNCISVGNVYSLWSLGHETVILQKVKRKKNDIIYNCKNFIKGNEVEIAYQLQTLRKSGVDINENFLMLLLRNTNCTSIITDLL